MRIISILTGAVVLAAVLAGCGGGAGGPADGPTGPPDVQPEEVNVGPFVMHPTAATNMQVQTLATEYGAAFAVFTGVTVDYVAVRERMDRVIFSGSRGGGWQLHTCGFFGDDLTKITANGRSNGTPCWSPDGSKIAWTFYTATLNGEILVRPAEGGAATHLTNNAADDEHPTWSPDGRWIAFHSDRSGRDRIWKMLADGTNQVQAVSPPIGSDETHPAWAPNASKILYASDRGGTNQIYRCNADGTGETHLITSTDADDSPAWEPGGHRLAYRRSVGGGLGSEIYTNNDRDASEDLFATGSTTEMQPCYSSDGSHLFFVSNREGGVNSIWAKQTDFPYRLHRITDAAGADKEPHLGSPVPQISRVLIGPNGSDHGYNPIHDAAVAGVVSFDNDGYLNFVRLGIPPASGSSLTATTLDDAGMNLVGVVLSAPNMYYIEEDAGVGMNPIMWDFSGATSRSALLYMNAYTGKLVAVVDMGDSIHSATADAPAPVTHDQTGSSTIAHGDFKRVWDADGELVAEGEIGSVEIDAASRVVRAY